MAIKKNKKGTYDVDVSFKKLNNSYGRKRKKDISTLKEAKLIESELIAIYKDGEIKNVTLIQAFNQFKDYKSIRVKETHILKMETYGNLFNDLWDCDIEKITFKHIFNLQKVLLNKGLSTNYINGCTNLMYSIFEHSRKFNNTSNNPCKDIERLKSNKPKDKITFWSFEEFSKFDNVIDDLEYKTLFNLLYYTGIRKGELQALNWNDINFKNRTVNIDKNLTFRSKDNLYKITTPKTLNSYRVISLPVKVIDLLQALKVHKKGYDLFKNDHFVFGKPQTPIHDSTLTRRKNKYCALAGVKEIKLHDFRHSHASLLINNDVNILVVAKRLGHADIKMTLNTYSHLFKASEDDALSFLNTL